MEIPDCYDPVYQAERREQEADEAALHCQSCGGLVRDEIWDICGDLLCDRCARRMYLRRVEDLIYGNE